METFDAPNINEVSLVFHEISAISPYSNELELYSVKISYVPAETCVVFGSIEEYLHSFATTPITSEEMAANIADHLFRELAPRALKVETTQESGRLEVISRAVRQDKPLATLG